MGSISFRPVWSNNLQMGLAEPLAQKVGHRKNSSGPCETQPIASRKSIELINETHRGNTWNLMTRKKEVYAFYPCKTEPLASRKTIKLINDLTPTHRGVTWNLMMRKKRNIYAFYPFAHIACYMPKYMHI